MSQTYRALLQGNQLTWLEEVPVLLTGETAVPVQVLVNMQEIAETEEDRQKRVLLVLTKLAALHAFNDVEDPSAWQREIREDRPLPTRY